MKSFFQSFLLLVFILSLAPQSALSQSQTKYKVVINHEEQYSVWPTSKKLTKGWEATGTRGSQAECQKYIAEVWTDMRPLSIRKMDLPDDTRYLVIVNHEEQYSIWPEKLELPKRWRETEMKGMLYPCVKYINEVWTDMRPLSLRDTRKKRMEKN